MGSISSLYPVSGVLAVPSVLTPPEQPKGKKAAVDKLIGGGGVNAKTKNVLEPMLHRQDLYRWDQDSHRWGAGSPAGHPILGCSGLGLFQGHTRDGMGQPLEQQTLMRGSGFLIWRRSPQGCPENGGPSGGTLGPGCLLSGSARDRHTSCVLPWTCAWNRWQSGVQALLLFSVLRSLVRWAHTASGMPLGICHAAETAQRQARGAPSWGQTPEQLRV